MSKEVGEQREKAQENFGNHDFASFATTIDKNTGFFVYFIVF